MILIMVTMMMVSFLSSCLHLLRVCLFVRALVVSVCFVIFLVRCFVAFFRCFAFESVSFPCVFWSVYFTLLLWFYFFLPCFFPHFLPTIVYLLRSGLLESWHACVPRGGGSWSSPGVIATWRRGRRRCSPPKRSFSASTYDTASKLFTPRSDHDLYICLYLIYLYTVDHLQ